MSHILLQQVLEFHKKFKKTIGDPRFPNVAAEQKFRLELIDEEYTELIEALEDPKLSDRERIVKVADALGDMAYVIFGAAICWGIDLASVLDAIHSSNMTKSLGAKRSDGKVLKGKDYTPPKIEETLVMCAHDYQGSCFDTTGDSTWWPEPTAIQGEECFLPQPVEEVPEEVTQKIMLAAKDQAKILAMKDIKEDFIDTKPQRKIIEQDGMILFPELTPEEKKQLHERVSHSEEDHTCGCTERCITGHMTSYGAFVFDCPCGRTHAVQGKLGSRGGLAPKGKAECICGNAFIVDFTTAATPYVTLTTIEELRKLDV